MDEQQLFESIGGKVSDSLKGQLFGKPCFKVDGKAFVCFYENEMVFKLSGEAHKEALALESAHLFDPSGKGRPMKEWVQVPYKFREYWASLANKAAQYVREK